MDKKGQWNNFLTTSPPPFHNHIIMIIFIIAIIMLIIIILIIFIIAVIMIMIKKMEQVHTILSPGDHLGLVIRGGSEYGVSRWWWWSWRRSWWSSWWWWSWPCNDHNQHQKYLQVGIYVLQVDEDSLAESLGLQVNTFDLFINLI